MSLGCSQIELFYIYSSRNVVMWMSAIAAVVPPPGGDDGPKVANDLCKSLQVVYHNFYSK